MLLAPAAGTPTAAAPAPPPPATNAAATPAAASPELQAAQALDKARAAYEYGDMELVAETARQVAEGRVHPTPVQRAQALRLLGIALYLTGRPEGAESAFLELLRLRPNVRLDPTNTRPDVISFFETVRAQHYEEIQRAVRDRPGKHFILSLLPPAGQLQNGNRTRALMIGAVEVLSLGVAIGTYAQLRSWVRDSDQTFPGHTSDAQTLKTLNNVAVGVFAATVIVGIIDGVANFNRDSNEPPLAFLTPSGLGFHF